jgi:hypothetical protein
MFEGGVVEINCELVRLDSQDYWKQLHAKLKSIDVRRSKLDAEEMELLFEAEDTELHRRLGHPTMTAYMVAELECSVHSANEKLRVSRELFELPLTAAEFREGTLNWTKVRELTRVVIEDTENEWLDAVEGKTSTEVQQMVRGLKKGARPGDRPDLSTVKEWIGLEVTPQVAAMWRQVRIALDDEAGRHLGDDELAEQICKRVLTPEAPVEAPSKPAFQLAVTTCRVCKQAQQVGPGVENAITESALERALCDAVFVGDLEDEEPMRAKSIIPYPTRRKVFIRDRFVCQVPRCTSKRFLEVHHIKRRVDGGGHEPWNLLVLCDGHHKLHHDGMITIRGQAPDQLVFETPLSPARD